MLGFVVSKVNIQHYFLQDTISIINKKNISIPVTLARHLRRHTTRPTSTTHASTPPTLTRHHPLHACQNATLANTLPTKANFHATQTSTPPRFERHPRKHATRASISQISDRVIYFAGVNYI